MPDTSTARAGTFLAFRNHSYRYLWPSSLLSQVGQSVQVFVLSWLVLERTDSPWHVALVGFFVMAPMFLLGLVGGMLTDRLDRKRLIIAMRCVTLVAAVTMTVLLGTGLAQFWHAYLVIFVVGAGWAVDMPARRALIHDLMGSSGVSNAVALDVLNNQASKVLGPLLGGLIITMSGLTEAFVVVSVLYAASAALMVMTRPPNPLTDRLKRRSPLRDMTEGFQYIRGQQTILAVMAISVVANVFLFSFHPMVLVIGRDVLHVGPGLIGVLQSAEGIGAFLGTLLIASMSTMRYHGRIYVGGTMGAMIALLLFSLSHWYALSFPLLLGLGLCIAGFVTMQWTIITLVAREEMRGRALGALTLSIGVGPVGFLLTGAVATAASPSFAVGLNGAVGAVLLALVWLLMPTIRRGTVPEHKPGGPG